MPALLTRTSSRPYRVCTSSAAAWMLAASVTSSWMACAAELAGHLLAEALVGAGHERGERVGHRG
jgi:hypothetical protein